MVSDASLLGAQHITTGLASLSSQTSFKKEMDTIRNERSRVINKSWNNLFRNRPQRDCPPDAQIVKNEKILKLSVKTGLILFSELIHYY